MKSLRRLGFLLTLALALCLGQYAAAIHDLGHATSQIHKQDSKPGSSKCDECGLFAELSGAMGAQAPVAPFVAAATPRESFIRERNASLAPRYRHLSRGPPQAFA